MRVYEIAKEVGIPNKDLIAKIRALGLEVNNHMSSLDADDVARIRRSLEKEKQASSAPQQTQRLSTGRRASPAVDRRQGAHGRLGEFPLRPSDGGCRACFALGCVVNRWNDQWGDRGRRERRPGRSPPCRRGPGASGAGTVARRAVTCRAVARRAGGSRHIVARRRFEAARAVGQPRCGGERARRARDAEQHPSDGADPPVMRPISTGHEEPRVHAQGTPQVEARNQVQVANHQQAPRVQPAAASDVGGVRVFRVWNVFFLGFRRFRGGLRANNGVGIRSDWNDSATRCRRR